MKRIIEIWLVFLLTFSSCSDSLDKSPLDQFGEDVVWQDLSLMEVFVNNIYYNIYHGFDGKIGMQMLCDEAVRASDRGAGNVLKSMVSPSDYSAFTQVGQTKLCWDHLYKNVRACNLFLDNIQKNTYEDQATLTRLTGEIHFLRAFNYYTFAIQYGGVPIIDKAYSLDDDPLVKRDSFEETIRFAADECDKAAALLQLENTENNKGRATRGAALALKARILLYAASELANNSSWAKGYSNPELISYVGGDRASRWQAAKNAAKAVIDLNLYALHKAEPSPDEDIVKNLDEIYLLKETKEDIFVRFFLPKTPEGTETYQPGLQFSSGGYHCQGSNNPTQNAVDAYEMKDGTKFDWNNPAHKAAPYQDREPRFYSNILYDGALWRERPDDVIALDPIGIIQTGYYENADGSITGGLDTRNSPVEDWNCTYSGYYQKKQIDPAVAPWFDVQDLPWRHIRYAEILLSYAEACNELGEDSEALTYLNMIRKRSGLPDKNTSGDRLRQDIRHERRVELMFEGHRYYDIRRWMIAPEVISNYAQAIDILYKYGEPTPVYASKDIPDREMIWLDRAYFMPIQLNEMNRNGLLIQNPLY
jgi:hypothetical protein